MNEGIECQSISPRCGEVSDVDVRIASSLHLTPEQKSLLSTASLVVICVFECDVLDLKPFFYKILPSNNLETKNDSPDETESQSRASVNNIVRSQVFKVHVLLAKEVQRLLHIFQTVDAHLSACWFGLKYRF